MLIKDNRMLSQLELLERITPLVEQNARICQKKLTILARRAKQTETITTITADGVETTNTAQMGDYIVQNQTEAKEEYIIRAPKFKTKYQFMARASGAWSRYKPIGKILALELTENTLKALDMPHEFHFMAKWGQPMVAKKGDYLALSLDKTEVYRIALKEFWETYENG
jgi:hypothetical protein